MITSSIRCGAEHVIQVAERAERAQAVLRLGAERDVADDVDGCPRAAAEGVGDRLDVRARADEHRPAAIADLLEQPAGHLRVDLAQARDVDDPERERAVEDEVAGEVVAVGQREQRPEQCRLEEAGRDLGEPGPARPVGVEVQPREREHGQQVGEGARKWSVLTHASCRVKPRRNASLIEVAVSSAAQTPRKSSASRMTTRENVRIPPPRSRKARQRRPGATHVARGQRHRPGTLGAGALGNGLFVVDRHDPGRLPIRSSHPSKRGRDGEVAMKRVRGATRRPRPSWPDQPPMSLALPDFCRVSSNPCLQRDRRLPPQQLPGPSDVGLADLRIVGRQRLIARSQMTTR